MGWIRLGRGGLFSIEPYKTDLNMFKHCKLNDQRHCASCNKELPKGTHAYGKDWVRICLNCEDKLFDEGIRALKEVIKEIKDARKYHELNKEQWENENALAKL